MYNHINTALLRLRKYVIVAAIIVTVILIIYGVATRYYRFKESWFYYSNSDPLRLYFVDNNGEYCYSNLDSHKNNRKYRLYKYDARKKVMNEVLNSQISRDFYVKHGFLFYIANHNVIMKGLNSGIATPVHSLRNDEFVSSIDCDKTGNYIAVLCGNNRGRACYYSLVIIDMKDKDIYEYNVGRSDYNEIKTVSISGKGNRCVYTFNGQVYLYEVLYKRCSMLFSGREAFISRSGEYIYNATEEGGRYSLYQYCIESKTSVSVEGLFVERYASGFEMSHSNPLLAISDNKFIAFCANITKGSYRGKRIIIYNADNEEFCIVTPQNDRGKIMTAFGLAISPNGRYTAFVGENITNKDRRVRNIYVYDRENGNIEF